MHSEIIHNVNAITRAAFRQIETHSTKPKTLHREGEILLTTSDV